MTKVSKAARSLFRHPHISNLVGFGGHLLHSAKIDSMELKLAWNRVWKFVGNRRAQVFGGVHQDSFMRQVIRGRRKAAVKRNKSTNRTISPEGICRRQQSREDWSWHTPLSTTAEIFWCTVVCGQTDYIFDKNKFLSAHVFHRWQTLCLTTTMFLRPHLHYLYTIRDTISPFSFTLNFALFFALFFH